ncbi:MAG: MATE family efflux transporter, partial [Eubacteriaceae bacterium]|nr:MATE family efflux transporter [Eubacteriaceae bacterium]
VTAILVNLVLNYWLIFGRLGLPRLEVRGADVATVVSRFVELCVVLTWVLTHAERCPFFRGALGSLRIPGSLALRIVKVGTPLFANEFLWSLGMTVINQCYSTRGLSSVAAVNITMTISNLFAIVMMASGTAISIMVGQALGSGDKQAARELDTKLIFTALAANTAVAAVLFAFSGAIPRLYNVEDSVRTLASSLLRLEAVYFPMGAVITAVYFTIRSGGKTVITFLFDSFYTWVVPVSLAYCLSRFTSMDVLGMFFLVRAIDVIKLVIGLSMLRRDFWLNDMVHDLS